MSSRVINLFLRIWSWIFGVDPNSSQAHDAAAEDASPCIDVVKARRTWITEEQRKLLKELKPGKPIEVSAKLSAPSSYKKFASNVAANLAHYHGVGKCSIRKTGSNKLMAWRIE